TVCIGRPSAQTARLLQEYTGLPSNRTVQAPHSPRSQPIFVPVKPKWSRRTSTSVQRSSISMLRRTPFTVRRMVVRGTALGCVVAFDAWAASIVRPVVATATAAPVPSRNFRREMPFLFLGLLMEGYFMSGRTYMTRTVPLDVGLGLFRRSGDARRACPRVLPL